MKLAHTALLASAFLVVSYVVVPAPAQAGGRACAALVSNAKKSVDDATDLAIDVARRGLPVRRQVEALEVSVQAELLSKSDIPDMCVVHTMLTQELVDLCARADAFRAHEAELRQTQFQIVLGRYEAALLHVQKAWKDGLMAEDIAIKEMYTMRVDAFDYLQSLGLTDIRLRLQEAITEMIVRGDQAMDRSEAAHDAFKKLYELRLEAAIAVLKERIADGTFTKLDFKRVADAVAVLDNLEFVMQPYTCGS
jgi:hypothetical protein